MYLRGGRAPPDCDLTLLPVGSRALPDALADDERNMVAPEKKRQKQTVVSKLTLKPNGNG